RVRLAALAALGFIALQYALGVATLLFVVPIPLAAAHQANAVLALTAAIVLLSELRAPARALISRGPRPQESP
ncbi:MAG: COX15/CtaA family protein, partial [Acetobacteraceae bacterium]